MWESNLKLEETNDVSDSMRTGGQSQRSQYVHIYIGKVQFWGKWFEFYQLKSFFEGVINILGEKIKRVIPGRINKGDLYFGFISMDSWG